eukprot:3723224-Pyramimonas_sp.AAC.1
MAMPWMGSRCMVVLVMSSCHCMLSPASSVSYLFDDRRISALDVRGRFATGACEGDRVEVRGYGVDTRGYGVDVRGYGADVRGYDLFADRRIFALEVRGRFTTGACEGDHGYILATDQSDAGHVGLFSRRTNQTQDARVYSHDGPLRRRKR